MYQSTEVGAILAITYEANYGTGTDTFSKIGRRIGSIKSYKRGALFNQGSAISGYSLLVFTMEPCAGVDTAWIGSAAARASKKNALDELAEYSLKYSLAWILTEQLLSGKRSDSSS